MGLSARAYVAEEIVEFVLGIKGRIVPLLDGLDTFPDGSTQPFELGLIFLFALFEQSQSFADYFAGVAEPARGDARFDEAVEVLGQVDVSRGHRAQNSSTGNVCQYRFRRALCLVG